ncbi:MAG: Ig-like domain-containing protein [Bacteroidota bacterium]
MRTLLINKIVWLFCWMGLAHLATAETINFSTNTAIGAAVVHFSKQSNSSNSTTTHIIRNISAHNIHPILRSPNVNTIRSVDGGVWENRVNEIQALADEYGPYCPGILFKGNVLQNDTFPENSTLSLAKDATYGKVTFTPEGVFTYTPLDNTCGQDTFLYQVCHQNRTICDTASVITTFADDEVPVLLNIPDDIVIGLDDEIPPASAVTFSDNCPATDLRFTETNTQGLRGCDSHNYTITRTWTATDQCGNSASHSQIIKVVDQTTPDVFRIHTLPNGTKMVAGMMEFTSQYWKTVHLPYNFTDNPIVFAQLVTTNDSSTVTVRLRNVGQNQFQMRLQGPANEDGVYLKENVAWMAMEKGTQTTGYQFQADTVSVTNGWATVPFFQSFPSIPLFFTKMQTFRDADAATLRQNGVNWNNAKVSVQEENSVDPNLAHTAESVAYLAIDRTNQLTNEAGETIGETGRSSVTDAWKTVTLNHQYHHPIVIANSLSIDDFDAATVQIRNVTATSFEVRVAEWAYLDGLHRAETVGYLVVEGSLPLRTPDNYCTDPNQPIDFSNELVGLDNTGDFLPITYVEDLEFSGTQQLILRNWQAMDSCGNIGVVTQAIACPAIALRSKTYLQGALLGSNDPTLMRDDLRKAGLIPTMEPYTDLPNFDHLGAGSGAVLDESLLTIEGPNAIVDWVFLEIRDIADKTKVVANAVGLVQRDGDIISAKGDSLIVFPTARQGNYYASVRHRNHVCMLSTSPQAFTPTNVPLFDFTQPNSVINNVGVVERELQAMWGGDLNQDNKVIYQGPQNDLFFIFMEVLTDPENTKFISNFVGQRYSTGDFNLDGKVIYQGPNNDRSDFLFNTTLLHPGNIGYFTNYILNINVKGGE